MKDILIKYETAILAKERKFDWEVFDMFGDKTGENLNKIKNSVAYGCIPYKFNTSENFNKENNKRCSAPTQSLLAKWLREKHGLYIMIIPTITSSWTYKIVTVLSERDNDVILGIKSVSDLPPYKNVCGYDFNTYEDAMEDALKESLKQIII